MDSYLALNLVLSISPHPPWKAMESIFETAEHGESVPVGNDQKKNAF